MAKLPTFSASNVSGGGGAVQMQAQQRATTKPFRQSTNIRAEDIYNQAGDQAMAQAIGNIGSLFNKVQLQKTEATYVQKKNEMREAFGRAMMDAEKEGKNADNYYRNWLKQTKDTLTKTGNSAIDKRLEMDYSTMSVNSSLDVINYVSKVAREEYLGNGVQLEKDFEVAISNGKVPVEDAIHEVNLYYQNGAGNGGFFSMETARQAVLDFTVKAHTEDIKGKIDNSSTTKELRAASNLIESSEYLIGLKNVDELNKYVVATQNKVYENNSINFATFKEDIEYRMNSALPITEEQANEYVELFGAKAYAKLKVDSIQGIREAAFSEGIFNQLIETDGLNLDNIDVVATELEMKLRRENPTNVKAVEEAISDAKRNAESVLKYGKEIEVKVGVSTAVKEVIEGRMPIDDLEFALTARYGDGYKKHWAYHVSEFQKNPAQHIDRLKYGDAYLEVSNAISSIFNPSTDQNTRIELINKHAQTFQMMLADRKSKVPQLNQVLHESHVEELRNLLADPSPDMDKSKIDAVTSLISLVGQDNLIAVSRQITSKALADGSKVDAAEMAVIFDGMRRGDNGIAERLRSADNAWAILKEAERKDSFTSFKNAGKDKFNALPRNDPMFQERLDLANKLFELDKTKLGNEKAFEVAISTAFDQQMIKTPGYTSNSYTSIPKTYYSKVKNQNISLDGAALEKKLDFLNNVLKGSNLMGTSPLSMIPFDDVARYSRYNKDSLTWKSAYSSDPFERKKARDKIAKQMDMDQTYWRYEPNGNAMGLHIRTEDGVGDELIFKIGLDHLLFEGNELNIFNKPTGSKEQYLDYINEFTSYLKEGIL